MPTSFPKGTTAPQVQVLTHTLLPLPEDTSTQPHGLTVNARIQPKGRACTWYIEYGATTAYGSSTTSRKLPGTLSCVYSESWASGLGGYLAGLTREALSHQNTEGGFIRWTVPGSGLDNNHTDGVGVVMLGPYGFPGHYNGRGEYPLMRLMLGGIRFDMRGATMTFKVRGNNIDTNGAEMCPWVQFDRNYKWIETSHPQNNRRPNWAYTDAAYTSLLSTGSWENVSVTFRSNTEKWTFAGRNQNEVPPNPQYVYGELDSGLGGMNVDMFLGMFIGVDPNDAPTGTVDFDDLVLRYRNNNVCAPSNGGTLASSPAGGSDASVLTDGYMLGTGHVWASGASPTLPMDFEYTFANAVTLECVIVRNNPACPAKQVELFVSEDNGANWTSLGTRDVPNTHDDGDNYLFAEWTLNNATLDPDDEWTFVPIHANAVNRIRVRINSKWSANAADQVGLGSIEAFGDGANYGTDNDWYDVSRDLVLAAGTYHYRVVAVTDKGTAYGSDQTVTVT